MPVRIPTVAILIPCHNEEKMLAKCIDSCLSQTLQATEVIVVNDGSTDRSAKILAAYGDRIKVVHIPVATGNKSRAQQVGLQHVTADIFIATDGDTILDENFVRVATVAFLRDPNMAAMSGYVKSLRYNWLTAIRETDYVVGQEIYKRAQSYINFLMVIPGCAGAFRTSLFKDGTINFDHDTLTEDLDFTYKVHAARLKIRYERAAIAYTQDPPTLRSYIDQMRRWYGGAWQNLRKHFALARRTNAALQLSLSYIEGLVFGAAFFVLPVVNLSLFVTMLFFYLLIAIALGTFAAIRRGRWDLFLYSPLGVIITMINAMIFIEQFVLEVILKRANMIWLKPERRTMTERQLNVSRI